MVPKATGLDPGVVSRLRFGCAAGATLVLSRNTSMPPTPGLFALSRLIGDAMFSGPGAPNRPVTKAGIARPKSSPVWFVALGISRTGQPAPWIPFQLLREEVCSLVALPPIAGSVLPSRNRLQLSPVFRPKPT